IYSGEKVTLRCEIQGGTQWTYEWRPTNRNSPSSNEYKINSATESHSGEYSCRGIGDYKLTECSNSVRLTVISTADRPTATLAAGSTTIPEGGSVTLSCSVEPSAGWKFRWFRRTINTPEAEITTNNIENRNITVTQEGIYRCEGVRGNPAFISHLSNEVTIESTDKPKAELSSDASKMPVGGRVLLTCSVMSSSSSSSSSDWKYDWYKEQNSSKPLTSQDADFPSNGQMSVSEEGLYWCRGGRGEPVYYTDYSDPISIKTNYPNKPSLVLQPNWSQIYRGEKVTLRCEIHGGTQWTYEWRTTNRKSPSSSEYRINSATDADSGEYRCRGKREGFSLTPWSNVVKIIVSKPKPVLSVSPSWLNPGASVTLSCEGLEHQPAGWRFFWYKAVPDPSKWDQTSSYNYELLPGSTSGTEQNSFIINGPTHTARYRCRAGRGESNIYTYYSEPRLVWSADPRPAASLSVNPDRVQHFKYGSVSLNCEGNSAEWRLKRISETDGPVSITCSYQRTSTGSTCTINISWSGSRVYWCESKSGEFSNAVNITAQGKIYMYLFFFDLF
uniref:Ig-like domain-containing protein n=1 Tax=Poecilia formosa TaxID=48698 RepID=A0A096MEY6_POEFO